MSHRPALPPHLADEEESRELQERFSKIGPQGPSKYGPGGRRIAKARGRKKR